MCDYVLIVTGLLFVFGRAAGEVDCSGLYNFPLTWVDFPPYCFRTDDVTTVSEDKNTVIGAIHGLAQDMVRACCGEGAKVVPTTQVANARQLEQQLSGAPTLVYPVTRLSQHSVLDAVVPDWLFLPVVELSGSYVLIDLETLNNVVVDALLGAWPLALLVLSAAGVAGFSVWFLDRSYNKEHFPMSFVEGGWEGIWWAIVTATTVGYGDRAPRSIPARLFGLTWMLLGIILMSIFTATLVSAIQAEDKIGSDIKGAKVAVVTGSQEERFAFSAGAIPTSFQTLHQVLDHLQEGAAEFALVDPYYALYFSDVLTERNIHPQDILAHSGVHGILAVNMSISARQCFAKYVLTRHNDAFGFIMESVGSLKSMRGRTAHHTSHKLLGSNMVAIYITCLVFTAMITSCCSWEFLVYRPRLRRLIAKAKSKRSLDASHASLLNENEDVHSL